MSYHYLHTTLPSFICDLNFWIADSQLIYSPHALHLRFYDERIEAHLEMALQDWNRVQTWVEENVALPPLEVRVGVDRTARRAEQIYDYVDARMLATEAYRLYLDVTANSTGTPTLGSISTTSQAA